MDNFDIYVNVERPPAPARRRECYCQCPEKMDKDFTSYTKTRQDGLSAAEHVQQSDERSCQCAAVLLALLCLLLLAGLVTTAFLYAKNDLENKKQRALMVSLMDNLTSERDHLWNQSSELERETKQFQQRIDNLSENKSAFIKMLQGEGWKYFKGSLYHLSSTKKNWDESRNECLQKGVDLLIINSREEQYFINQLKTYAWMGMTDKDREGTWKWVDGTPVIMSYWHSSEPNGEEKENCGNIKNHDVTNSWNDEDCLILLPFICEKNLK